MPSGGRDVVRRLLRRVFTEHSEPSPPRVRDRDTGSALAAMVEAGLAEYVALRDEVMQIRARQTQLFVVSGAGVGALVSSAFLTTLSADRSALAGTLFVAALVIGAALVNYVGYTSLILVIGEYLAARSREMRALLAQMPGNPSRLPAGILTWERYVGERAMNFRSLEGVTVWAAASFELIAMAVIGLALWISGIYVVWKYSSEQTGIDYLLLGCTSVALVFILLFILLSFVSNARRSAAMRKSADPQ